MAEQSAKRIIAIDGPAGAGKSTLAKAVAARLGIPYLDTGAMYRALTLKALRTGTPMEDQDRLVRLAQATRIRLEGVPPAETRVLLDGEDVTQAIRTDEVTNQTFHVARAPRIRGIMVDWQRAIGRDSDIVVEGRDIGTVVFPDAAFKFYLDARFDVRAGRRINEFRQKGFEVDEQRMADDLKDRDHKDFTRDVGPLKKAADAVVIDSTDMTIDQVVEAIMRHVRGRDGRRPIES